MASSAPSTAAQSGPAIVCFWSDQGLACVERLVAMGMEGADAEALLEALLAGPTPQEQSQGLWSAIPPGTALVGLEISPLADAISVHLRFPADFLSSGLDAALSDAIVQQVAWTLEPFAYRTVHVDAFDPAVGQFRPLSDFLPDLPLPEKEEAAGESGVPYLAGPAYVGQPPAPGQGQPQGALSGRTVYVSAGHGWEWEYDGRCACTRWKTQRPVYQGFIEDHNNAEAVNQYLLQYLWNAGATVIPVRERDLNSAQVIVDNDNPAPGYRETGVWTTSDWAGYRGLTYRYATTVVGTATASAVWTATLPADGQYAVYAWYREGPNRPLDAHYTIYHAGGATEVVVNQRAHGNTWRYLGTYGFRAGEEARVALDNRSAVAGQAVIADAIRFGGGVFDDLAGIQTSASYPPNKPWWEVATFYYAQRMGMSQPPNDVTARPIYARWEHADTFEDAVYLSWHTNGYNGTIRGTESYIHDTQPVTGSDRLQYWVHTELVHDIRAGWDASWIDRGMKTRDLGEVRELWDPRGAAYSIPGVLVEIAFHDNPADAAALKEPAFQRLAARAMVQGIVRYFEERDGIDLTLFPEPPTHLRVENVGGGRVRLSWQPSPTDGVGLVGDPASGYRVYTSADGVGWSNGIPVTGSTAYTLTGLAEGQLLFVRVSAVNAGGESFPTEVLSARVGDRVEALVVNGFDRLNSSMLVPEYDPIEGYNLRMTLGLMNRYDYVVQHGEVISYPFNSASNEAVASGLVNLTAYKLVDWILGEESSQDETLNAAEQAALAAFLDGGGALLISGSEIGWDLDYLGSASDRAFYNTRLRADYVGDDAGTYQVAPAPGSLFDGMAPFRFDAPGFYDADYPDQLTPLNGSTAALVYQGGAGGVAAVQYANGCQRLVYLGFPFETIWPEARPVVMGRMLDFAAICLTPPVNTWITSPENGSAHRVAPAFEGMAEAGGAAAVDRVEVQVRRDGDGKYWTGSGWGAETWLLASGTTTWSRALPALTDGLYTLRARAWTTDGYSDTTPAEAVFFYDTLSPTATTLITPTGGVTVSAIPSLELRWTPVTDSGSPLAYIVELDGQVVCTTTQTVHTVASLADGPHVWRVQVVDAAGNRSAWATGSFVVSRYHIWLPLTMRQYGEAQPVCVNVVANGGFETDAGWTLNQRAIYSADQAHSGARSARVGIPPGEPGAYVYSSVMQALTLTAGSRATLRLWVYPIGEGSDTGDWHYIGLFDQWNAYRALDTWRSDARAWSERQYDLSPYLGQQVRLYIGTRNDGDDDTSALYVDDVRVEVCP